MMVRDEAVAVASNALGVPTLTFKARLHVSMRMHAHLEVEAVDLAAARRICAELNPYEVVNEQGLTFEAEDGPWEWEGDEILYLDPLALEDDDGSLLEEDIEFDKRIDGEPFAWVATQIVKELALIDKRQKKVTPRLRALIKRAHQACAKETDSECSADETAAAATPEAGEPDRLAADAQPDARADAQPQGAELQPAGSQGAGGELDGVEHRLGHDALSAA